MEKIVYVEYSGLGELTVRLTGGGACAKLTDGMRADIAVFQLRVLADLLEKGVTEREKGRGDDSFRIN